MGTRKSPVVIEKARNNFPAYMRGCVSKGRTVAETQRNIAEAIVFHLRGMAKCGDPTPDEPSSPVATVSVPFDSKLWRPQSRAGARRRALAPASSPGSRIVPRLRKRKKA